MFGSDQFQNTKIRGKVLVQQSINLTEMPSLIHRIMLLHIHSMHKLTQARKEYMTLQTYSVPSSDALLNKKTFETHHPAKSSRFESLTPMQGTTQILFLSMTKVSGCNIAKYSNF